MLSFTAVSLRPCPGEGKLLLRVQGGTVELFGLVVHICCSIRSRMLNLGRPEYSLGESLGHQIIPAPFPELQGWEGGAGKLPPACGTVQVAEGGVSQIGSVELGQSDILFSLS